MVSRDALIIFEENVLTEVSSQQADPSFVKQLKDFEKKKTQKKKAGNTNISSYACNHYCFLLKWFVTFPSYNTQPNLNYDFPSHFMLFVHPPFQVTLLQILLTMEKQIEIVITMFLGYFFG